MEKVYGILAHIVLNPCSNFLAFAVGLKKFLLSSCEYTTLGFRSLRSGLLDTSPRIAASVLFRVPYYRFVV